MVKFKHWGKKTKNWSSKDQVAYEQRIQRYNEAVRRQPLSNLVDDDDDFESVEDLRNTRKKPTVSNPKGDERSKKDMKRKANPKCADSKDGEDVEIEEELGNTREKSTVGNSKGDDRRKKDMKRKANPKGADSKDGEDVEIEEELGNTRKKPTVGNSKGDDRRKTKNKERKADPNVADFEDDVEFEERGFKTQCRPIGITEVVSNLNQKQKEDVESIGFGGLLFISIESTSHRIVKKLVTNFHSTSRMLRINENHSFVVTPNDVCDVLLLPRNEDKKVIDMKKQEQLGSIPLMQQWHKDHGIQPRTSCGAIKDLLLSLKDGGDDFKRLFVIFCLSSFLAPNANRTANFNPIPSLVDVDEIRNLDWCSYVLDRICYVVDKFKRGNINFSGCGLLLQIMYFHRLKWKGVEEPSTLPLIQHWDTKRLRDRVKEEDASGELGMGEWVVGLYPISSKEKVSKNCQKVPSERASPKEVVKDPYEDSNDPSKFIFTCEMPKDELTNSEIKKIAKDDVHASIMMMKRDLSVMTGFHLKNIMRLKENISENPLNDNEAQSPVSSNDKWYEDEGLHAYMDELELKFKKMKEVANDILPDVDEENDEVNHAINLSGCRRNEEGEFSFDIDHGYLSDFLKKNKKLLETMGREEKEIVDYCSFVDESTRTTMYCVFSAGITHNLTRCDMMSLSPFEMIWQTIIDAWSLILNNSKDVGQSKKIFYFHTGHSRDLSLVVDSDEQVQENETSVLGCWSYWIEQYPTIDLKSYDMLFLPIHRNDHFFAVVVNFGRKKMQYLDNRKYDNDAEYVQVVGIVQKLMSIFLKKLDHPKADEIITYTFEDVAFSWKTKKPNLDCGIFLMNNMELFKGEVYATPNLGTAMVRRALRATYCVRIIMSDVNEKKSEVRRMVVDFYNSKPGLINAEIEKRKVEAAGHKKKKKMKH